MSDYWERRQAKNMWKYMDDAEKTAEEIAKLYRRGYRVLTSGMEDIFERYRDKHHLSDEEAMQLLNTMRDPSDIDELKRKLASAPSGSEKAELLAKLESAAYQHRIARLQDIQKQVDAIMTGIYKQEKLISDKAYTKLAENVYYKTIFEAQKKTGLGFSFSYVDENVIDKLLHSKWSGKNYSRRIWDNTQNLAEKIKHELMVNFMTGRTNNDAANAIAMQTGRGINNARRLVRTEDAYVANQMEMQAYEECDIEKYRIVATLDLRTSKICREQDGKVYKVSEQKVGVNCPPFHPYCRSTTIMDIAPEQLARMKRRARNPETGKTEIVPANMTYQEWYEKNVSGNPEAELKEKMVQNRSSDRAQYGRYKTVLGEENVPETLDKFQRMKYTNSKKWEQAKHDYRIVNSYEDNSGHMPAKKIIELDQRAFNIKTKEFTGKAKTKVNIAVMEIDGEFKVANSQVNFVTDPPYINFKGDKASIVIKADKTQFKTKTIGSHDRWMDSEAKLFEYAASVAQDGKKHYINILSEKCMCESCLGVMQQFQDKYKNVSVNAVSNKKERAEKNKNRPWDYRVRG